MGAIDGMHDDPNQRLVRALRALYERAHMGIRLGLEPMQNACKRADHPERAFEAVHVAGTNGKGSTSAMVEAMVRASGRRTGLYTSPHLCRFAERIRIDGEPLSDERLADVLERAMALGPDLSFFETATLAAFLAFRDHGVEVGIVEVGIGGRFDATNVLPSPRVTAITRIALDHMDKLGATLERIAGEKAGIAKPNVPMVVGPVAEGPRRVIEEAANAVGAPVVSVDASIEEKVPSDAVALSGKYQRTNVAMAWTIAEILGLDEPSRLRGLEAARWPGRFERIDRDDGPYLLDGAHNPDGAAALVESLEADPRARVLVFGAMADKAWPEVLDRLVRLAPRPEQRVYVEPAGRAAAPTHLLAERHPGRTAPNVEAALSTARAIGGPSALVVVTGSLYLVGSARAHLLGLPQDPPIAL